MPKPAVMKSARLSAITRMTFYGPDLNRIAETIRRNQEQGVRDPYDSEERLYADEDGNILFGNEADPSTYRRLTKITQETFYGTSSARLARERDFVRENMPSGTVHTTDGTYDGWAYSITNDFNDIYELFLWYDPASYRYKVSLISPQLAGTVGVHDCHLYTDGTLCLNRAGGYKKMKAAYSRSVLWTLGASCYQRGLGFQFSTD